MYSGKIGILGGGQLGRMLIQAGIDYNLRFKVLDPDPNAPCKSLAEFECGKLTDYDTVLSFAKDCDLITIEIENVNTAALKTLERMGKKIFPQPEVIEIIQNKRTQKQFYQSNKIPTADFILVNNKNDILSNKDFIPAVNKLGKEGYDGRGVQILRSPSDLNKSFDAPGLLEKLIDFEKEIAVIVARNEKGETSTFPPVELVFHPEANLVEYLFSPSQLSTTIADQAKSIAEHLVKSFNMVGLLAVEMFVTKEGKVLVNECAPRPHNSGHQSIEGNKTSQYHQHLRAILNMPLGDTEIISNSVMVNLLGEDGYEGVAKYSGLDECLALSGVNVHLYGKHITRPFRKMGHVTIIDNDIESLNRKANFVRQHLKVIS